MNNTTDQPSLWELQRVIQAGHRELSADIQALNARLDSYLLREVYEAHRLADEQRRAADADRIARLEAEVERLREGNRVALRTAISSFVAPIVVAVVLAFVLRGGQS